MLSVSYRQLKGKQIAIHIAGKVHTLIKQIRAQNRGEDELSDDNPCLIDWLILTSTTDLCFQSLNIRRQTLRQYEDS